jgi:HAD superfamily hydrolase (TIGR01509 family)
MNKPLKAVLFDLDGTLCDCTEVHFDSFNKALKQVCSFEIDKKDHLVNYNGLPTKKKLEKLSVLLNLNESDKQQIWELKQKFTKQSVLELLQTDKEKQELLQYLKDKSIKLACVTNSILETTEIMLKQTGIYSYFDLIITNDMLISPKPHGEGYIRSMITFGSFPEETLIVEDSPVGEQAAKATSALIWKVVGFEEVNLNNFKAKYD